MIAAFVLAATVFLISTSDGEFEITTDDPKIAAMLGENGGIVVEDRQTNARYTLKRGKNRLDSGNYDLAVTTPAGLDLNTSKFRISRFGHVTTSIVVHAPSLTVDRPTSEVALKSRDSAPIHMNPSEKTKAIVDSNQWGPPENLGVVNSPGYDTGPCVSSDGLTLLFQTHRQRIELRDPVQLWQARRSSTNEPFGEPVRWMMLSTANS